MPLSVRTAAPADGPRIAEFALSLFDQHRGYDPDRFAKLGNLEGAARYYTSRAGAEDGTVLVAENEGSIVGFAYLEYERVDYENLLENAVWLHDLYVDESARGSGAGKMLIEASADFARQLGADKVVLSVAAKNHSAHEFFGRLGFRETMIEMTLNV
jgi:GNAT superfamily N-acetyltransferase